MAKRKSARERRRALFSDLKHGEIAPIYLIHGPDPYMLDHALEAITSAVCPNGVNEFNYHPIRGRDTTGVAIRESVELLPFLSERRLVVVRDLQAMSKKELEELRDYFEDPSPTTCLVFRAMTQSQQLDGRSSIVKSLKKHAAVYEFTAYYDNELGDFADRAAAKLGLRLDPDSRDYLVEAVGSDLSSLVGAIEKVDLYLGPESGSK